jgi:acetylornithine deacetylase/succinyl-diaminopimelate desuccinylase-like protein
MRILRQLLDRIEDSTSGRILLDSFHVEIPAHRIEEAELAGTAGVDPRLELPFAGGTVSDATDAADALIATTWRPAMATIGIDGVPALADAGNVLRPQTTLWLSFRIPPTCDPDAAIAELRAVVEADPPSGATVSLTITESARGWNAAATADWLAKALDQASTAHFGRPSGWWGLGGSIPFMAMLGEKYPAAQFVVTGVLGPGSNAHGPNEFLDLPTARRVSACVAQVIDAHARR